MSFSKFLRWTSNFYANAVPDRFHCRFAVGLSEDGLSGHEDARAGGDYQRRRGRVDAAVDLDAGRDTPLPDHLSYVTDLAHNRFDELLSAEAGVDRHHQDKVAELDGRAQRFRRRGGVDGDVRLLPPL